MKKVAQSVVERKPYNEMTAEEILADAKIKAWDDACSFARQFLILGREVQVTGEKYTNGELYAYKVLVTKNGIVEGERVIPFRNPKEEK